MNILKVDTHIDITIDSPPSTSSTTPSPSPLAQSDTVPLSLSRQSSQTDTLETASTTSLSTPTVKFAPLPTIGPRKRRSNQPLGMAARAQLVARKRDREKQGQNGDLVLSASPMWSSAELDEQRRRIELMAARHAEFQARENAQQVSRECDELDDDHPDRSDLSEVGIEDPILIIGKIVKVAGKTLWNRVSGSKPETRPIGRERRRRDLSPLPILIKSVPPEQVNADAWKEPTQQPETRHENDMAAEQNNQPAEDVDEYESETIEPVSPLDASDEEVIPAMTCSAPPD